MDEKQYAVLLTETQDVKVMACDSGKDIFDIGREAIGCDWIELVEAETLAKDGLLMMIDEEGNCPFSNSSPMRFAASSQDMTCAIRAYRAEPPGAKRIPSSAYHALMRPCSVAMPLPP